MGWSTPTFHADAEFTGTGLERGEALAKDIAHIEQQYGLVAPVPQPDGPGYTYAATLRLLAASNPPAFICHYYNFYFAHTAGGRMIGHSVSNVCLGGWEGAFYQWEGDVKVWGGVGDVLRSALAWSGSVWPGWLVAQHECPAPLCLWVLLGPFLSCRSSSPSPLQRPTALR